MDAKIVVGADTSEVERAARAVIDEWRGVGGSITSALTGVTHSLADVALASGRVNFSSQHEQVKQFEAATAHMAVAMGRDIESLRSEFISLGKEIAMRPEQMLAWSQAVGKVTYSFDDAKKALGGVASLAAETGRNAEEYQGIAVQLNRMGVS